MFLICFALGFDSSEGKKCCVSRAYAVCWVTPNFWENALTDKKKLLKNVYQGDWCERINTHSSTMHVIKRLKVTLHFCVNLPFLVTCATFVCNLPISNEKAFSILIHFTVLYSQVVTKFIKKSQVYKDSWTVDKETNKKIPIEISLLMTLDHPNIVRFLVVCLYDTIFFTFLFP